jgi:uncharacterized membrane protein YebE (DUF533 family)
MFSARDLLGQVMQTAMNDTTASRVRHALGPQGLGAPDSPLARLFGQGGGLGGLASGAGSMLGDAGRAVQNGHPLAVGGLGALAGAVFGGGGGALKGALGGGVLALLGGLALSTLRKGQPEQAPGAETGAAAPPLGLREPQDEVEEAELERRARLVLQAMIAAAKADGQIDGGEVQRIVGKLQEEGAGDEAQAFVRDEMQKPQDLEALLGQVDSQETAVEVYGASLLAIEVDTPAEREYLRHLAERLDLDAEIVRRVHQALDAPAAA